MALLQLTLLLLLLVAATQAGADGPQVLHDPYYGGFLAAYNLHEHSPSYPDLQYPSPAHHHSPHYHQEHVYEEPKRPSAFQYSVKDRYHGTEFSRHESSDATGTKGQYQVQLPDGRLQTVIYHADEGGYHAEVIYDGEPQHPKPQDDDTHHTTPKPVVYHSTPEPIYHSTPKPVVYHSTPEPVYHSTPKPVAYHTTPEPIYHSTPSSIVYHSTPEPVHHSTPEGIYHSTSRSVHRSTPKPIHQTEPNPVFSEPDPLYHPPPKPDHQSTDSTYHSTTDQVYHSVSKPVYQNTPKPVYHSTPNPESIFLSPRSESTNRAASHHPEVHFQVIDHGSPDGEHGPREAEYTVQREEVPRRRGSVGPGYRTSTVYKPSRNAHGFTRFSAEPPHELKTHSSAQPDHEAVFHSQQPAYEVVHSSQPTYEVIHSSQPAYEVVHSSHPAYDYEIGPLSTQHSSPVLFVLADGRSAESLDLTTHPRRLVTSRSRSTTEKSISTPPPPVHAQPFSQALTSTDKQFKDSHSTLVKPEDPNPTPIITPHAQAKPTDDHLILKVNVNEPLFRSDTPPLTPAPRITFDDLVSQPKHLL